MAILTRRGMQSLLTRIMETGGMSESMETDIKRLKDDFDEREGILKKYGETYDGEDRDEYEWEGYKNTDNDASNSDTVELVPRDEYDAIKGTYEDLKKRYIERFMGYNPDTCDSQIVRSQEEDIRRDGTYQTFDDLLKNVEP